MMNNYVRLAALIVILVVGAGCQEGDSNQPTATVVTKSEPTAIVEPTPEPDTPAPAVETPTIETTVESTTEETGENEPPTPQSSATLLPSATPTETPIPASAVDAIKLIPIVENGFVKPLYLTHANDDRLFVVEEQGRIRTVRDGQLLADPFLDIQDRVNSVALERGLLGLAFHPDYANSGTFYIHYSNLNGDSIISRFSVDPGNPDAVDPNSEVVYLTIDQPYENHNSGQLAFGPDGYLYVGVGDGGGANDPFLAGQDPGTLLGTILRLDVDQIDGAYRVPDSNPFVGDDGGLDEIWAWGLRNPWRFSFDRTTGDLFIGDVGQNLWEEVHFQPAASTGGENYGWNILEGSHCFVEQDCDKSGLELPIFEYPHEEGCSITGGYMYRGSQFLELYGNYFVADYCQGKIWRLFSEDAGGWEAALVLDSNFVISSFGEDSQGELYLMDHVGGSLYQIGP